MYYVIQILDYCYGTYVSYIKITDTGYTETDFDSATVFETVGDLEKISLISSTTREFVIKYVMDDKILNDLYNL